MNKKAIREKLTVEFKNVSIYGGVWQVKRSYFYRSGMTTDGIFAKVKEIIPSAVMVDSGDHWHSFVGSAKDGSKQDSYMWVKFTVPVPEPMPCDEGFKKWFKSPITTADMMAM